MAENEIFNIYRVHPMLLPNKNYTRWEGYLGTGVSSFKVVIYTPNYPSITGIVLKAPNEIRSIISKQASNLLKNSNLTDFLQCITHIMKKQQSNIETSSLWNRDFINLYKMLQQDIQAEVSASNVFDIDCYLNWIKLKYNDATDFTHYITIGLSANYTNVPLTVLEVDLPNEVLHNFKQVAKLGDMYYVFKSTVDSLIPFWTAMDELSSSSWVVEPENPRKKDVHRRILISDRLSLMISFNPLSLSTVPDVMFLGSLNAVSSGRSIYQQNLEMFGWNGEVDIVENIMRLCGVSELPLKPAITDEMTEMGNECFICFAYSLENQPPPSKFCQNSNCSSFYHWICLHEWLTTISTSSEVYEFVSGPCPYCNQTLWCPVRQGTVS